MEHAFGCHRVSVSFTILAAAATGISRKSSSAIASKPLVKCFDKPSQGGVTR